MSDFIDVEIKGEIVEKLMKLTKNELAEKFCIASLEVSVLKDDIIKLQTKFDKAEAYVGQGRAMVEAVMNRWYEYDVV